MEIYRPLQAIPRGLLGLFQLKNAGRNPSEIGSQLDVQFDSTQLYLQAYAQDWGQSTVAVAGGTVGYQAFTGVTGPIQVPSQESWYVEEFTIRPGVLLAAETCEFACAMFIGSAGNANYTLGASSGARSGPLVRPLATARNFFAPPTANLCVDVWQNTSAGNITYSGFVRFTRLPS